MGAETCVPVIDVDMTRGRLVVDDDDEPNANNRNMQQMENKKIRVLPK
jgi:hypothetical protein